MKTWECCYCGMPALMEPFEEDGLVLQELVAQGCSCPSLAFVLPKEEKSGTEDAPGGPGE